MNVLFGLGGQFNELYYASLAAFRVSTIFLWPPIRSNEQVIMFQSYDLLIFFAL